MALLIIYQHSRRVNKKTALTNKQPGIHIGIFSKKSFTYIDSRVIIILHTKQNFILQKLESGSEILNQTYGDWQTLLKLAPKRQKTLHYTYTDIYIKRSHSQSIRVYSFTLYHKLVGKKHKATCTVHKDGIRGYTDNGDVAINGLWWSVTVTKRCQQQQLGLLCYILMQLSCDTRSLLES